jgi:lysozyme family protein
MTTPLQDQVFKWTLIDEGGYGNDPDDNGGPTAWGVTIEQYVNYCRKKGLPKPTVEDLKKLTQDTAKDVYVALYWDPLRASEMPSPGISYLLFDCGLLHGIGRAAIWLQLAVGVKADGSIGPKTMAAVEAADPQKVIEKITEYRFERIRNHPDNWKFGRGWTNRVTRVKTRSLKLLAATNPKSPTKNS